MGPRTRSWVAAAIAASMLAAACSSDGDTETAASSSTIDATTTSLEPTIERPLTTTSSTIAPTTTTEDPVRDCAIAPSGRHLVDVAPDDPDGGLNLREDPGVDTEVLLPLPAGTEVEAAGGCVDIVDSGEWWSVAAVTDASVTGWVAAGFLEPHEIDACESVVTSLDPLDDLSLTIADMDGDGIDDRVYIGNDASEPTARMVVEFGAGGAAGGNLGVAVAAEVVAVFRPIGASHDLVMYRDALGGGASTSRYVFAEVDGCTVRDIGSVEAGASAGWGALGYCLEPTPLGTRLWVWNAVGETAEEGLANRVDDPFHYYRGRFVPGTGELDGRECPESSEPPSFHLAPAFIDTRALGRTAPTLDELIIEVAAVVGRDEDSTVTIIGEPEVVDAQGGLVTFDVIGLKDDSVAGFRVRLEFGTVESDGTVTAVRADRVELIGFCSRGVTETGFCV